MKHSASDQKERHNMPNTCQSIIHLFEVADAYFDALLAVEAVLTVAHDCDFPDVDHLYSIAREGLTGHIGDEYGRETAETIINVCYGQNLHPSQVALQMGLINKRTTK